MVVGQVRPAIDLLGLPGRDGVGGTILAIREIKRRVGVGRPAGAMLAPEHADLVVEGHQRRDIVLVDCGVVALAGRGLRVEGRRRAPDVVGGGAAVHPDLVALRIGDPQLAGRVLVEHHGLGAARAHRDWEIGIEAIGLGAGVVAIAIEQRSGAGAARHNIEVSAVP